MAKLNIGNLAKTTEDKKDTPIQIQINGVVKSEITRTTFNTDSDKYKSFKSWTVQHNISIREYLEIQFKNYLQSNKISKADIENVFEISAPCRKPFIIDKNLLHELNIWLDKNELSLKSLINKIIHDTIGGN